MAYFLSFFIVFFKFSLFARDLGTYDQTFDVKEENLIQYMQQKSQQVSMDQIQTAFKNLRPRFNAVGLSEARIYKRFYFDPTVCAQEDIVDHQGNIIVPKGKCENPLDYTTLAAPLLFLDGDNEAHLAWARHQVPEAKWILVSGNPFTVEKIEKRDIFFDQQRQLSKKLALTCVPVKVSQADKLLCIEECPSREVP